MFQKFHKVIKKIPIMSNSAEKHIQENILNELFSNKLEELGDFKRNQELINQSMSKKYQSIYEQNQSILERISKLELYQVASQVTVFQHFNSKITRKVIIELIFKETNAIYKTDDPNRVSLEVANQKTSQVEF